ncbi:cytochrome bd ubiquinol oxidase subunit [Amylostereum chailletii]|nr:cytochrome bd ubiquinol oxidase subunit [Amylostereum chailletii]
MFGPLGFSLAPQIRASRGLANALKPLATWYANLAGYRKMGLVYDDLRAFLCMPSFTLLLTVLPLNAVVEERPDVQRALGRLTERQTYDRVYRFKRASQLSVLHTDLPKDQWVKPEEDVRYLAPHVTEVSKEDAERARWDTIKVESRH